MLTLASSNIISKVEIHKDRIPFGYFYRITDTLTGKYYVGVRYKRGIDFTNDLGIKYFSSSKWLQRLIRNNRHSRFIFEIRKIFYINDKNMLHNATKNDIISMENKTKKSLLSYEERVLKRLKAGSNPRLINLVASYRDVLLIKHAQENRSYF